MLKIVGSILFCLILIGCQNNEVEEAQLGFLDDWKMYHVTYDEVSPLGDWSNTSLSMEQTDEDSGTFIIENSPVESIWSNTGFWKQLGTQKSLDKDLFLMNDSSYVGFEVKNDTLCLERIIDWTAPPCDEDDPDSPYNCTLELQGIWVFKLARKK